MTTRRALLVCGMTGALLCAGRAGLAQAPGKVYRIGWLSSGPYAGTPLRDAFNQGMRELGWVEGRHYMIDNLYTEGRNERLPALAAELVQRKVDLLVGAGSPPTTALKNATATIPILFFYAGDPVGSGFVESLARPGGNVTGLGGLGPGMHTKQLELLREVVPKASRIAMLHNPAFSLHALNRAEVEPAARSLGITLRPIELRSPDDIDPAFATLAREPVDALQIFGQPFLFAQGARVAKLAIEQRLPAIIPFQEVARDGILMSYGSKLIDDIRRLPYFVDRILKGAKPAELPVEQPSRFYLTVNQETAKALGLTIPQSVLLRADEVIQ
jgi:putative tryptophan/tyrosine transport system substrate-binding protein